MNQKTLVCLSIASIIIACIALVIAVNPFNQTESPMKQIGSFSSSLTSTPTPSPMQLKPPFNVTFQQIQDDGNNRIYVAHISLTTTVNLQNLIIYQQHSKPIENGATDWQEQLTKKGNWDGSEFNQEFTISYSENFIAPLIIEWNGYGSQTFDFPRDMYPPSASFPDFKVVFELVPKTETDSRNYDVYLVHVSLPSKLVLHDVRFTQYAQLQDGILGSACLPLVPAESVIDFPNGISKSDTTSSLSFVVWDGSEFTLSIKVGGTMTFGGSWGAAAIKITWLNNQLLGETFTANTP